MSSHHSVGVDVSPTLTNPDMILPEYTHDKFNYDYKYDYGYQDRFGPGDHESHFAWNSQQPTALDANMASYTFNQEYANLDGQHSFLTPIIYGNGTMLSDIGEVTETESVVSKPSVPRTRLTGGANKATARGKSHIPSLAATGPPYKSIKDRARELHAERARRLSLESTSTVTTQERHEMLADLADCAGHESNVGGGDDHVLDDNDSVFMGDDEDSLACAYQYPSENEYGSDHKVRRSYDPDDVAAASLSKRAEAILANAKRRLSMMEGNLNKARNINSHYGPFSPPSSSISSIGSISPSRDRDRPSTICATLTSKTNKKAGNTTRMSVQSCVSSSEELSASSYPQRAGSAFGAAGGYRQPLIHQHNLEPTPETSAQHDRVDEVADHYGGFRRLSHVQPESYAPTRSVGVGLDHHHRSQSCIPEFADTRAGARSSCISSRSRNRSPDGAQSSSAVQVRDLREQMSDLKSKISHLRNQARADSMQRRSIQSIQEANPFTNATTDSWSGRDAPADASTDVAASANPNAQADTPAYSSNRVSVANQTDTARNSLFLKPIPILLPGRSQSASPSKFTPPSRQEFANDAANKHSEVWDPLDHVLENAEQEDLEEEVRRVPQEDPQADAPYDGLIDGYDEGQDDDSSAQMDELLSVYESESGDSIYHDAVQISHEDREDAFDYEHFFLHSAIGAIRQHATRRSDSVNSYTSDDSVETTKGPAAPSAPSIVPQDRGISRAESYMSSTTVDSFQTAAESRQGFRNDHEAEYNHNDDTFVTNVLTDHTATASFRSVSSGESTPLQPRRMMFPPLNNATSTSLAVQGRYVGDGYSNRDSGDMASEGNESPGWHHNQVKSDTRRKRQTSVSSFGSAGTTRSFPLVSQKLKSHTSGLPTPQGTPEGKPRDGRGAAVPLDALRVEDRQNVERVIESLGRCVLGLSESAHSSDEALAYRRRIERALKVLDGTHQ